MNLGDSYHGGRPFQTVDEYEQAKRCTRCDCLQILAGFPLHKQSDGTYQRSTRCIECWRDHSAAQVAKRNGQEGLGL